MDTNWTSPQFTGSAPYVWTDDMQEISGFGGGYEDACRRMLAAALAWLDAHPKAEPLFHGFRGVYGIFTEDNADAKALSKAACDACPEGATGAMHQAVISAALWISKHGWDRFQQQKREARAADEARDRKAGS